MISALLPNVVTVQAATTEVNTSTILEEFSESDIIEEIDSFITVDSGKLSITNEPLLEELINNNLEAANAAFNPDSALESTNDIIVSIKDQLHTVNEGIDNNELFVQADKEIVELNQFSTMANGYSDWAHEIRRHWWGVKRIFRSKAAASSFAYEMSTSGNMVGATSVLLVGAPPAAGAVILSGIYLNQMASSINHKMNLYSKIYLNVTYALIFATGEHKD
ncbi:MAG: hypothetical protein R6U02_00700 [Alkalibacterium sp.]|uniref:hypothetical protein n=1 Tax=Alkalibacterium sp. TaxID=1872447 RepID=UPI0039704840